MTIARASLCVGATALFLFSGSQAHAQDDGTHARLGPVSFLEWREIGPAVVGGRVSDIAVVIDVSERHGVGRRVSSRVVSKHGSALPVRRRDRHA